MPDKPRVSIIICTCSRAEDLRQTLARLGQICVPDTLPAELIVVDNASTDDTAAVVRDCRLPHMPVRLLSEPQPGKSRGLNRAVAAAQGEILLFTDDDVRPPPNWIEGMCAPILAGEADAVQGGIRLAPHLKRPWMTALHLAQVASTEENPPDYRPDLTGANMAVARRVFEKVPQFDAEIGPGTASGGEDTLFSWQLEQAGYTLHYAPDISVEHHFDPSRLERQKQLRFAREGGVSNAYMAYHWNHATVQRPYLGFLRAWLRLGVWRLRRWPEWHTVEGAPDWEIGLIKDLSFYRRYFQEARRPRNYDKHGLVKRPQKTGR